MLDEIKAAAALMPGYSDQDIIRLSAQIGLVRLKRIDYRIAEIIDTAASAESSESLRAAEDEKKYGEGKK